MKDQYCGDVNDFRKYGLLRSLMRSELSTAVCWMLTPGDAKTDGRHISYLSQQAKWRHLDPELFDSMRMIVHEHGRAVKHVQASGVLAGSRFHSEIVPDHAIGRRQWFENALIAAKGIDLLFFDPDNGLEVASVRYGNKGSGKYLYWREVEEAWRAGHSLLIYQHFPRRERGAYVSSLVEELYRRTGSPMIVPFATPHVVFFLVSQQRHQVPLENTIPFTKTWAQTLAYGDIST